MLGGIGVLVRSMDRPTLDRALASAARQTHRPSEIVVLAACGARHRPLAESYDGVPLRLVVPEQPLDRAAAANALLAASRSSWLDFLDDDDEFLPDHLQQLATALAHRPDVRVAHSLTTIVDDHGRIVGRFGRAHHRLELLQHSQFHLMAALFHRSLVDEGAHFDESLPIHEDLDFWIQCAQRTRFAFVDRPTNRWHAFIGTSGAGGGGNFQPARVARRLRKLQEKWTSLREAWSAEPDALVFFGQAALRAGRLALALELLERAFEAAPDDVDVLEACGVANYRNGNVERARMLLERAWRLRPGDPGIAENLRLVGLTPRSAPR